MLGSIMAPAKWQSAQWVHELLFEVSVDFATLWHGNAAITAAVVTSASSAATAAATTFPAMAEIGMAAAMTPDKGSHASIHINTSLRKKFITM